MTPSTVREFHQSLLAERVLVTLTVTEPDTVAPAAGELIVKEAAAKIDLGTSITTANSKTAVSLMAMGPL